MFERDLLNAAASKIDMIAIVAGFLAGVGLQLMLALTAGA